MNSAMFLLVWWIAPYRRMAVPAITIIPTKVFAERGMPLQDWERVGRLAAIVAVAVISYVLTSAYLWARLCLVYKRRYRLNCLETKTWIGSGKLQ